ncbi:MULTISPECIES: sensor histidine kinase [Catenuloplanes]|uniref:histidine kinase n=1 Tax=Catenuloplanes niger TaxID=587534 RepID=A0AAE3ZM00_9ACTN|nr:histidine kinase [Catenuloplanes niger]MDR7321171.1 signal transduction histidine kinase [Catenuloplanes niger]
MPTRTGLGAGPGAGRPVRGRAVVPVSNRYAARVLQRLPWIERIRRVWRARSVTERDGVVALLLVAPGFFPPLAQIGTRLGELPERPLDGLGVAAGLAMTLPLVLRRTRPALALAAVAAGFAVQELGGYATFASVGLLVALYSAGAHQSRFRRAVAAAATVSYLLLVAALVAAGSPTPADGYPLLFVALAGAWGIGAWARRARATEAERRRLAARAALAAERERIARELHDVVTHHVTAMVVQAGAAQFVASSPEKVTANLTAIGETGRRALGELRDLLGVLDPARRAPMDRLPTLAQVTELVEQARAAGQPVELRAVGEHPDLGAGRELAAYRVVQEALTNAMKYATGARTLVRLTCRADGLDIEVTTSGAARAAPGVGGSGRGLAGLRERVELFGGAFEAGPHPDGFTVRARIPVGDPG